VLAHIHDALIMDMSHYMDGGKPMCRPDGSVIEFVVIYDPETRENLTLTIDPECTIDKRPALLSRCDIECSMRVQRKAGNRKDGGTFVGGATPKLTVLSFAPAHAASNGSATLPPGKTTAKTAS
jgi:hypothetical protein